MSIALHDLDVFAGGALINVENVERKVCHDTVRALMCSARLAVSRAWLPHGWHRSSTHNRSAKVWRHYTALDKGGRAIFSISSRDPRKAQSCERSSICPTLVSPRIAGTWP